MSQPNIVFILIDDMGWADIESFGSSFYETPNIDRLAREGMKFTDAYASCPVSSPTRASIMSGKYPARVGVTQYIGGNGKGRLLGAPYIDHLPQSETSVASALGEGGYQTWHVGKWHLGGDEYYPDKHGFDVNIGGCYAGCPRTYFSPWNLPTIENGPEGQYLDDKLGDEAARLIRQRDPDRPFFLNMNFYLVHVPLQAPQPLIDKYQAKAKALGLDGLQAVEEGEFHPVEHKRDKRVVRRLIQSHPVYAAMVEILDNNVGKILDALEEQGLADDTLVIFTSDNGGLSTSEGSPTCNAPLHEGKGWMYEGGTREPTLMRWPKVIRPGSQCEVPITSPDFYPTFLDVAGLDLRPEQHVDGVSIAPLLHGDNQLDRDAIFWHYPHYSNQGGTPGCSVRMGDWKLIEFFEDGKLELYNLRDDISEQNDLAATDPQRVSQMHDRLKAWREEIEAIEPQPNPDYKPPDDPLAAPTV